MRHKGHHINIMNWIAVLKKHFYVSIIDSEMYTQLILFCNNYK